MTKQQFMRKLISRLFLRLPLSEIKEVRHEYQNYFNDGVKNGKTEAELIKECGSPELVATELLSEHGNITENIIDNTPLRFLIMCITIVVIGVAIIPMQMHSNYKEFFRSFGNVELGEILAVILHSLILPSLTVFILGGKQLFNRAHKKSKTLYIVYAVNLLIALLASRIPILLAKSLIEYVNLNLYNSDIISNFNFFYLLKPPLLQTGGIMFSINIFFVLSLLFMWLLAGYMALKKDVLFIPLCFLNSAMLVQLVNLNALLREMDVPSNAMEYIEKIEYLSIIGAVVFILALVATVLYYISRKKGGAASGCTAKKGSA